MLIADKKVHDWISSFNALDNELYAGVVPNSDAWKFLRDRIPRLDCPDAALEEIYYFRWWTFRKHLKWTPGGFVITEFLPEVSWSGAYNTISCAAMHHFREGRWLRNNCFLTDYLAFWLGPESSPRTYSFPLADSAWKLYEVNGRMQMLTENLPRFVANYRAWEKSNMTECGLFYQTDNHDGMEFSLSGAGLRATINSYLFADAAAIAGIAAAAGDKALFREFERKAETLRRLVLEKLWDPERKFFMVARADSHYHLSTIRELHGYTPWYAGLPPSGAGYEEAWAQLLDDRGFQAPYGPTTAEQRAEGFSISYSGHECQWNGPSWPYATSVTLTALANVLTDYRQDTVSPAAYRRLLKTYICSHRRTLSDSRRVPWIDENLNPYTGDWISRTRLAAWENGTWCAVKGGVERGKDYNHSTFCDLIISQLWGVRPEPLRQKLRLAPLFDASEWEYGALTEVRIADADWDFVWDRSGCRYNIGAGFTVRRNGYVVYRSPLPGRCEIDS